MIYIDDSEPEGELEPAFPYRDVQIQRDVDAHALYDILGEVGRGKFGVVYKCQDKSNGLKLAAKFVPTPKKEDRRNVEREVEIMNSLQHHLITQLYAAYEHNKMMCVVQELVEGGELFDRVVDDEFVLTERVCVVFIRQVCEAMEFIHRNNILHLDLKPENILCLTQEGNRIKIIDFGLARKFDPNKKLQILFGTPEFVAPEVVNFDCISYGTDMWSVGVITYVLISGLSPFMGETDIETMANVTIAKYDFEDESFSSVSPECIDFISKLLVKDLDTRMTAAQCLKHKWLQRRPKSPPKVSPKPLTIPEASLKAATPSPIPPSIDGDHSSEASNENEESGSLTGTKELDSTKDNLKNFIERWEEHPNSPYVFDVEGNVIAPLSETEYKKMKAHGPDSISSSRGEYRMTDRANVSPALAAVAAAAVANSASESEADCASAFACSALAPNKNNSNANINTINCNTKRTRTEQTTQKSPANVVTVSVVVSPAIPTTATTTTCSQRQQQQEQQQHLIRST